MQNLMLVSLASPAIRKMHRKVTAAIIALGKEANPVEMQETIQEIMVRQMIKGGLPKKLARRIMASNMERIGNIAFLVSPFT
ncbi:hypothetical protein RB598_002232 [Gaeumannomyces tritici]